MEEPVGAKMKTYKENSKMRKPYIQIQKEAVEKYNMILNPNSTCRERMHVHLRTRMICKWDYTSSLKSTFDLFHEIGHCENNKMSMRVCEKEYYASVWAVYTLLVDYGIKIDDKTIKAYADYIDDEKARGIRRGGGGYAELDFTNYCKTLYASWKGV